jgi:hypothetical protein
MSMTEQQIIEADNTIKKFLGYTLITPAMRKNPNTWRESYWENKDVVRPFTPVLCTQHMLPFYNSWNNLINLVDHIETNVLDGGVNVVIDGDNCHISYSNEYEIHCMGLNKKQAVLASIAAFINWYNTTNP